MNQNRSLIVWLLILCSGCQAIPTNISLTSVRDFSKFNSTASQAEPGNSVQDGSLTETTSMRTVSSEGESDNASDALLPIAEMNEASAPSLLQTFSDRLGVREPFDFRFAEGKHRQRPLVILGQNANDSSDPSLPVKTVVDSNDYFANPNSIDDELDALPALIVQRIVCDHQQFYSPDSLRFLGTGFVIGAAMANTDADQEVFDWVNGGLNRSEHRSWKRFLHGTKNFGDGRYTLPVFASCWVLGEVFEQSSAMGRAGVWGERSIRGFIVGAPFVALTQLATGASRPGETNSAARWRPFHDDNGVSGHSFMGSLPFLTAAMMTEDVNWKAGLYLASFATPLSRVSDGAHYPSQIILGWCAAYAAARSVAKVDRLDSGFDLLPYVSEDGDSGLLLQWDF